MPVDNFTQSSGFIIPDEGGEIFLVNRKPVRGLGENYEEIVTPSPKKETDKFIGVSLDTFNAEQIQKLNNINSILIKNIKDKWNGSLIASMCVGSHAYGLSTSESDLDVRAIHTVDLKHLLKMNPITSQSNNSVIELKSHNEENVDVVSNEVGKFCFLCLKCNPSVLDILFLPQEMIIYKNDFYDTLREHRQKFITKKQLVASYAGYATAQFERMANVDLSSKLKGNNFSASLFDVEKGLDFLDKNDIVNSHDYNFKNAMHGIRLVHALKYTLINKEVLVNFGEYLPGLGMDIRSGKFTFGEVLRIAYEEMKEIRELEKQSDLPEKADEDFIDDLLYDLRMGW